MSFITAHKKILLTTHRNPDGDGLGSEIALYWYLRQLGKQVKIINNDPLPEKFSFLGNKRIFGCLGDGKKKTYIASYDAVIFVDTHSIHKAGEAFFHRQPPSSNCFFIDHHQPPRPMKSPVMIDSKCSSTGEIVYHFLKYSGAVISRQMANGLYVAILTDTRSFQYSRTTPESHLIAAEMLRLGLHPEKIYRQVYATNTISQMRFLGEFLAKIRTAAAGKVVYAVMTKAFRKKHRITRSETQGFINHLLLIKGAELALLFREEDDNTIKISIRSRGNFPICSLAKKFGGGGHSFAASITGKPPNKKLVRQVLIEMQKLLAASCRLHET